jgi:hypothetical protein
MASSFPQAFITILGVHQNKQPTHQPKPTTAPPGTTTMSSQVLSRDEIEEIVIGNAMKHPQYRDALLKNPKKVIETQLNNKLPDGLNVKVVQESGDTIFLRLPHKISEGSELSDADLEQVAGGKGFGSDDTSNVSYTCNESIGGFNTRNEFSAEVSLI